jgi:hypothetical protein
MNQHVDRLCKVPLLMGAALALALGVWAGLARLGGVVPALMPHHVLAHGPLMVGGFLGALIGLERAVALGRWWAYPVPAAVVAGTLWLALSPDQRPAAWILTAASGGALLVALALGRRRPDLATAGLVLGTLCWFLGNLQWAVFGLVMLAIAWWMAFVLLTVMAERLELARILDPPRRARWAFLASVGLFLGGLLYAYADHELGVRIFGAGMIALAAWGLRWDLARRTVARGGSYRFTAVCLLGGYVWLTVAGAMMLIGGGRLSGLPWDGALHAFFLGFAFSMIFGHAPILARTVLGFELPYSPRFYVHLGLLHLSLLLRVGADFAGSSAGRSAGAILNLVAIAAFLLNTLRAAFAGAFDERPAAE